MGDEFYKHSAVERCMNDVQSLSLLNASLPAISVSGLLDILMTHNGNTSLRVKLGRLLGAVNKKDVKLPIYNPAVLNMSDEAYTSGQGGPVVNIVVPHVMGLIQSSEVSNAAAKFSFRDRTIRRWNYANGAVRIEESNKVPIIKSERMLDSSIIYRVDTNLQLMFSIVEEKSYPTSEVEGNMDLMFLKSGDGTYQEAVVVNQDKEVKIIEMSIGDEAGLIWEVVCEITKGLDDDGELNDYCEIYMALSKESLRVLQIAVQTEKDESFSKVQSIIDCLNKLYVYNAFLVFNIDVSTVYSDTGLYYPMLFGDSAADVKRHYNLKKIGLAGESAIEIVRTVNNDIKRLLISEYVAEKSAVLDLACGHGQDMLKYVEKDPTTFIGIDFSAQEIKEAWRRAQKPNLSHLGFRFYVGNMLLPETYEKFLTACPVFDTVSVQLAIHYTLSNYDAADHVLGSISKRLKPGGIFIGSCPSSFVIADRIKKQMTRDEEGTFSFGNSIYSVSFSYDAVSLYQKQDKNGSGFTLPGDASIPQWITDHQQLETNRTQTKLGQPDDRACHTLLESDPTYYLLNEMWGVPYHFWLIDHIDATEYVVPWRAFCRLAKKHGMTCLLAMPFDKYLEDMKSKNHTVAVRVARQLDYMIQRSRTGDMQMEVVSIYHVFAFQKEVSPDTDPKELALQPPSQGLIARLQKANIK